MRNKIRIREKGVGEDEDDKRKGEQAGLAQEGAYGEKGAKRGWRMRGPKMGKTKRHGTAPRGKKSMVMKACILRRAAAEMGPKALSCGGKKRVMN